MTATVEGQAEHDLLEEAYLRQMAQGGGRWFERRRPGYVLGGYAGLDSPTMSRITRLDIPEEGLAAALDDASGYFAERKLPWCVQLTPLSRPDRAPALLRKRAFVLASELMVMTWEHRGALPAAAEAVEVRPIGINDAGRFTGMTIEAFRMPARYYPALLDINESWIRNGAKAYVATMGGVPAGTALCTRVGEVAGIYNVGTLPGYRHHGVARALMRRVFEDFTEEGRARVLSLQVARGSVAEAMYLRMGFEPRYSWDLYARLV